MDPNESIGPPLRHQLSMPSQQRFGRHNEGPPVLSRQEPARRRPKTADRPQSSPGAPGLPMQGGEFVPKHSDFQLFDIIRAPTPERQRQDAAKDGIAEERSTEPPTRSDALHILRVVLPGALQSPVGQRHTPDPNFCTLQANVASGIISDHQSNRLRCRRTLEELADKRGQIRPCIGRVIAPVCVFPPSENFRGAARWPWERGWMRLRSVLTCLR
jgi:hypothetical protein